MTEELRVTIGAVAYDPKAVTIWEGMRAYFAGGGLATEFALYSSYERQVEALIAGQVDIAWNTPLAHVRVRRATKGTARSLGMRDTDRDFHSKIVARRGAGIARIEQLARRRLAVGSRDSTQARILPLYFLGEAGVDVSRVEVVPFDTDVGKHGDTGTSELDVVQAVRDGRAEAGAIGEAVWAQLRAAGGAEGELEEIWTSPPYDHCMFDALEGLPAAVAQRFEQLLFAMSWEDPRHRRILELEGLRQWVAPREEGYESLRAALDQRGGW